jgi:hypothetical protein
MRRLAVCQPQTDSKRGGVPPQTGMTGKLRKGLIDQGQQRSTIALKIKAAAQKALRFPPRQGRSLLKRVCGRVV